MCHDCYKKVQESMKKNLIKIKVNHFLKEENFPRSAQTFLNK